MSNLENKNTKVSSEESAGFIEDNNKSYIEHMGSLESEKSRIISTYGNFDQIRLRLGLNKRKFCQFLLVDPSAYTRWEKSKKGAPTYIYKSLEHALQGLDTLALSKDEAYIPMHSSFSQSLNSGGAAYTDLTESNKPISAPHLIQESKGLVAKHNNTLLKTFFGFLLALLLITNILLIFNKVV